MLADQAIFLIGSGGGEQTWLTPEAMCAQFPSWSIDGKIAFHAHHQGVGPAPDRARRLIHILAPGELSG